MKNIIRFIRENPVFADILLLILSMSLIHLFYVLYVSPISTKELEAALSLGSVPERTLWLILKDFEQELCLILGLWCLFLIFSRYQMRNEDNQLIAFDFLSLSENGADIDSIERRLEEAETLGMKGYMLAGVRIYVETFRSSTSSELAKREALDYFILTEENLDAKLNLINYILWAIPLSKGTLPQVTENLVSRLKIIINIELFGFASIPFLATLMARGVGLG